jgi:hypothetical protein
MHLVESNKNFDMINDFVDISYNSNALMLHPSVVAPGSAGVNGIFTLDVFIITNASQFVA